jgi:hypothetical protein
MTEILEEFKPPGLFDFVNAISESKKNLLSDPANIKYYDTFMANLAMSQHHDTIMIANALNMFPQIPKQQHFEFLLEMVPARRRRGAWAKKLPKEKDELTVSKALGCSIKLAREHLKLLTSSQIQALEAQVFEGGKG